MPRRWLSVVDGGYDFLIACEAWRLLRGADGGRWPFAPGPPSSGILLAGFPALESYPALEVWWLGCLGAVPPAGGMPLQG